MRLARSGGGARGSPGLQTRLLGRGDEGGVLEFLDRYPARDVFIASRVLNDGVLRSPGWSPLWGAFSGSGALRGVLHVGPNVVPAVDDAATCEALAPAASGSVATRMLVGERRSVGHLWKLIGHSYPAAREVRARQYVYSLEPGDLLQPRPAGRRRGRARLATPADEERVLHLSAAMYTEEMGENPLARDPAGYRRRVQVLTARGWTYFYELGGELQFKMDIGCASRRSAQVQGVYVPPELRGRGVGTTAMSACCELALQRQPALSLYVNDFNARAIALYERLGFHREPYDFQTIILP
jgi:ribosomal protein S18 acetylase RimI-like enzyme